MYFVMPSKYALETLPVPNNTEVKLREVSAKNVQWCVFLVSLVKKKPLKRLKHCCLASDQANHPLMLPATKLLSMA
jgi:hypothetical protein